MPVFDKRVKPGIGLLDVGSVRQDSSIRAGFAYQYDQKFESLLSYEVISLGTRAVTFRFNGWQIQKPLGGK
jgi:hypothetical protein